MPHANTMATLHPDGTKLVLDYLFVADFRDGTTIRQNADDQSATAPERSCFFDVLEAQKQGKELIRFSLVGEHTYSIDLTTGRFQVDSASFAVDERELVNFRVLYFRVRDSHFSGVGVYQGYSVAYRIGFQANDKATGENVQHYIEIQ
jgi:hypothetical protein